MARDPGAVIGLGRRVLRLEADSIRGAADRLGESFVQALRLLGSARGRVIVSGVGKSGLIARKIAATLTSTGTPATYLHPIDSLHGDLGIVSRDDVAIVLSKSGESGDMFGLLESLQRLAVPIIAITGVPDSTVARVAAVVLDGSVAEEACPHDLAPTSSTAVALALGDALAVALLEVKGFKPADFAALHPRGTLGSQLRPILRVRDVMLPPGGVVGPAATMREVVVSLAHHRGLAMVIVGERLAGVITPGDLTRMAEADTKFIEQPATKAMNRQPKVASPDDLAAAAVATMEQHGVIALPVIEDGGRVIGVVHLHDLMRAGAV